MQAWSSPSRATFAAWRMLSRSERQEVHERVLRRCPDRQTGGWARLRSVAPTVAVLRRSVSEAEAKIRTGRDGRRRPVDLFSGQAAVARVMAET